MLQKQWETNTPPSVNPLCIQFLSVKPWRVRSTSCGIPTDTTTDTCQKLHSVILFTPHGWFSTSGESGAWVAQPIVRSGIQCMPTLGDHPAGCSIQLRKGGWMPKERVLGGRNQPLQAGRPASCRLLRPAWVGRGKPGCFLPASKGLEMPLGAFQGLNPRSWIQILVTYWIPLSLVSSSVKWGEKPPHRVGW